MSIKPVMPSNYLILHRPLLLLLSIFPSMRVFCNEFSLILILGSVQLLNHVQLFVTHGL